MRTQIEISYKASHYCIIQIYFLRSGGSDSSHNRAIDWQYIWVGVQICYDIEHITSVPVVAE